MFGRRRRKDPTEAITEFWVWWSHARPRVAAAIEDGTTEKLADEISDQVHAIHDKLQWELSKGTRSRHSLVVAPAGDPALRATVARWLAVAPAADPLFEYHGSRQPDDNVFSARMQIAGQDLELSELRFAFSVAEGAHDVDVAVYHPVFAVLAPQAAQQVTFLALDWALGEEQVELWVGRVDTLTTPVPDLRTGPELRAAVDDLAAGHTEPLYAMLSGEDRHGTPIMAMVQVPLKPARWPRLDTHVAVTLRFAARDNGLPTEESLEELRDIEDRIIDAVGRDGEVVAHETSGGVRTIHVYVDGATGAGNAAVAGTAAAGSLRPTTKVTYDPSFSRVGHLRT